MGPGSYPKRSITDGTGLRLALRWAAVGLVGPLTGGATVAVAGSVPVCDSCGVAGVRGGGDSVVSLNDSSELSLVRSRPSVEPCARDRCECSHDGVSNESGDKVVEFSVGIVIRSPERGGLWG